MLDFASFHVCVKVALNFHSQTGSSQAEKEFVAFFKIFFKIYTSIHLSRKPIRNLNCGIIEIYYLSTDFKFEARRKKITAAGRGEALSPFAHLPNT